MTKHDAAVNLFEACELLRMVRSKVSNEAEPLIDLALTKVTLTGDSLYPDIIEEMRQRKSDPLM